MSPKTREVLNSDLGNRYTVGPSERLFPGLNDYTKIEQIAIGMLKAMLSAKYVNVQPLSGMVANQVAYYATINRGDTVLSVSEKYGGHYSHRAGHGEKKAETLLDLFGAQVAYLPFDENEYNLDMEASAELINKVKPKLIIVGASEMLFPIPLAELRKIADETKVGTKILYDAAHVFGLILGGCFQDPLNEGADMISSSTNKTLGAPCHGIVACNDEEKYKKAIEHALVPLFTSNHHAHHVTGLAVTLAEMQSFGKDYATQVIRNAKAMGKALDECGIKVVAAHKDYTESHTIVVDTQNNSSQLIVDLLASANIILNSCPVPTAPDGPDTGLRIGAAEMTRMGMKEPEMRLIAELIAEVVKNPSKIKSIRSKIIALREEFQDQHYCF